MHENKRAVLIGMALLLLVSTLSAQSVQTSVVKEKDNSEIFSLSNNKVIQKVWIRNEKLKGDQLIGQRGWLEDHHNLHQSGVYTDGNFALKMMWTAWSAPGRQVNANNQITFDKSDFKYQSYDFKKIEGGGAVLQLYFVPFKHSNTTQLRITYQLLPDKFYARRRIAVRDTVKESNWLDAFISRNGSVYSGRNSENAIIKKGAFGQPAAFTFNHGGAFFGIEYPAATTTLNGREKKDIHLRCREIIGTVVKDQWIPSKWVVEGLAPDHYVKSWFFKYLPDIRYTKNEPYALYNSWYDLRSPAFKEVAKNHIMDEKNIMTIINQFKKNMIEPYGIHLDAFVLDDGWDVHKSDWKLDNKTFPHGLKPISNALKKLGTTLGIWYGPTGGYSFRMDRINWMRNHGYEIIGHGQNSMLCLGGKKYSALFQKRTTDMVKNGGVGYFKWDGLQFSCSNPVHGHPIGVYSRRAILDSLIAKAKAVRAVNPDTYLNITSGTWLSPWWMEFANQIWMQGGDFGFADIPSYSQRDASMTYKDLVLYNDFHNLNEWFPISNLMTHGIIKGRLNEIGGKDDPLSKFTDDAMFYFGRGVTMYELYVSPDLLDAGEWNALSKSLKWAEGRFPVIDNNMFMIGGDPTKGETYGYVHYKGTNGVIALRNPQMKKQQIEVKLDPAYGLNSEARSLVLERVYPNHWISPDLYSAGARIYIPLEGYESAIYEVIPLDSIQRPLLAGVTFNEENQGGDTYQMKILKAGKQVKFLNPEKVKTVKVNSVKTAPLKMNIPEIASIAISKPDLQFNGNTVTAKMQFDSNTRLPRFVVFLRPDSVFRGREFPSGTLFVDGKAVKATTMHQKGAWAVYSYPLKKEIPGSHTFKFELQPNTGVSDWKGRSEVWFLDQEKVNPVTLSVTANNDFKEKPMPPSPYEKNAIARQVKLGEGSLVVQE